MSHKAAGRESGSKHMEKEPECKSRRTWTHGGTAQGKGGRSCLGEIPQPRAQVAFRLFRWPCSCPGGPRVRTKGTLISCAGLLCTWKNHPKKQIPLVLLKTSELLINSLVNCYKTETPHAFSWLENCVDYRVCLPRTRDKNKLSVSSADIRRGQKRDEGLDTSFSVLGKACRYFLACW